MNLNRVTIPFTNREVFEEVVWRLRSEVLDWIGDNSPGGIHTWARHRAINSGRVYGLNFDFRTMDQALMFKLRWGGE